MKITKLEYSSFIWFTIRACFAELTLVNLLHLIRQDCWIACILGSIFGLILFSLYEFLKVKYPNDNIITLNKKLFKKYGNIINLTLCIGSIIGAICTFWILVHFANSLFLFKTSSWIIGLSLIIPIGYASMKDIHIIGKVSLILFFISIIINILIMLGLTNGIDINNIKPIFESKNENIIFCSILFCGFNVAKSFFINVIPKNKIINYSTKFNYLIYIISCINLLNVAFTTICVFGIDLSNLYEYPAFQILKRVTILGVFDRMESILSVEGFFSIFIELIIFIYFAKDALIKTLNIKEKTNKYIVSFICLIVFIISNIIFVSHESGETFFKGPLIYIIYFICAFIPFITFFKSIYNTHIIKGKKSY